MLDNTTETTARYVPTGTPLTPRQLEIIDLLIEEASEVIHAASKLKRFGLDDHHPERAGETNTWTLSLEVGDLGLMLDLAHGEGMVFADGVLAGRERKRARLAQFSRYLP